MNIGAVYKSANRPVASVIIMGSCFFSDFGLFRGLKIGVPRVYLYRGTSIFKIIMTDDVSL